MPPRCTTAGQPSEPAHAGGQERRPKHRHGPEGRQVALGAGTRRGTRQPMPMSGSLRGGQRWRRCRAVQGFAPFLLCCPLSPVTMLGADTAPPHPHLIACPTLTVEGQLEAGGGSRRGAAGSSSGAAQQEQEQEQRAAHGQGLAGGPAAREEKRDLSSGYSPLPTAPRPRSLPGAAAGIGRTPSTGIGRPQHSTGLTG